MFDVETLFAGAHPHDVSDVGDVEVADAAVRPAHDRGHLVEAITGVGGWSWDDRTPLVF